MASYSGIKAMEKATELGLTNTSGWRSKKEEASLAGGSSNSMHTMGSASNPYAYDFAGSQTAMKALADWAVDSGLFTEVIYNSPGHYNHVHLGWATGKHETPYYYVNGQKFTGESNLDENGEAQTSGVTRTWEENSSQGIAQNILQNVTTVLLVVFFIVVGAAFFLKVFPKVEGIPNNIASAVKKVSGKKKASSTKKKAKKKGSEK